jgi:hypothetical protein
LSEEFKGKRISLTAGSGSRKAVAGNYGEASRDQSRKIQGY